MGDILRQTEKNKSILEIKTLYGNDFDNGIDQYFDYLYKRELGFYTNEPRKFPKINNEFIVPSNITNCIIDYSELLVSEYDKVIESLDMLGCQSIQIRVFDIIDYTIFYNFLSKFKNSRIYSIEIILPNKNQGKGKNEIINELKKIQHIVGRIDSVIFYGNRIMTKNNFKVEESITFIDTDCKITSEKNCGNCAAKYFSPNINFYNESLKYNTCLNKKVSINESGEIKNCPSLKKVFGNIKENKIEQILQVKDFKALWKINKDKVSVCKDCEYRNICTDCRAYIEDPNDIYSKPLKCGYDPYTNEWEDWSTNPLKQKAIEHYGMQDLIKEK
jgi:SPASM domain peptide maturase of grasp-with-spasm system